MSDIPLIPLRRERKKNVLVMNTKTLMYVLLQISISCIILLLPVFAPSLTSYTSTLLSLCTLFIFGSMVVGLPIRLLMILSNWLWKDKPARQEQPTSIDTPRRKKSSMRAVKAVVYILTWALLLYLLQPFIITMIWWQGYKLMLGNAFPLETVEEIFTMIEFAAYFVVSMALIVFACSQWNRYHYGELKKR